jgi:hypothetical protein
MGVLARRTTVTYNGDAVATRAVVVLEGDAGSLVDCETIVLVVDETILNRDIVAADVKAVRVRAERIAGRCMMSKHGRYKGGRVLTVVNGDVRNGERSLRRDRIHASGRVEDFDILEKPCQSRSMRDGC